MTLQYACCVIVASTDVPIICVSCMCGSIAKLHSGSEWTCPAFTSLQPKSIKKDSILVRMPHADNVITIALNWRCVIKTWRRVRINFTRILQQLLISPKLLIRMRTQLQTYVTLLALKAQLYLTGYKAQLYVKMMCNYKISVFSHCFLVMNNFLH